MNPRLLVSASLALSLTAAPLAAQCELDELLGAGVPLADHFAPALAVSGDTAVVGARDDAFLGTEAGAAHVLRRAGTTWSLEAVLRASDAAPGDFFGQRVAIDGDTILVGAQGADHVAVNAGAAYVFTRSGTTWTEQAKLTASDAGADDLFGLGVAVDGDRAVVAAPYDANFAGSMYAFERVAGVWTETQKFTGSEAITFDLFGLHPVLEGDRLVVGCPDDNLVFGETDEGSMYVFERVAGAWVETAFVPNPMPASSDNFGQAIDFEGDRIVVGAPYRDGPATTNTGVVYVYERVAGVWTPTAQLAAPDGAAFEFFGLGLSLEGDDLLAAAPGHDRSLSDALSDQENRGAVHRYRRTGATWTRVARLTPSDGEVDDLFGVTVVHGGPTALIATSSVADAGSVYVFGIDASACPLAADNFEVSVTDGESVLWRLDAGPTHALRPYLVLGTTAGTSPGITVAGVTLPLNVDGPAGLFVRSLTMPNAPPLLGTLGLLDLAGRSTAALNLPPVLNRDPALAGLTLHFAYAVFAGLPGTPVFASNPVHVNLVP